jgi:hypothetical protein
MDDSEKYEPPKEEGKDKAIAIARAGIASIPVVGNAAIELLPLLFTAPLERRRQRWMEEVATALRSLEENRGIKLEELQSNEAFITILVQASQAAMRNHQQEKIEAFRNAVSNSASGIDIDEDLQILFVRNVDELTPSHFTLLGFLRDNESKFADVEKYEQLLQDFKEQHPESEIGHEEFKLLCEDLKARLLLRVSPNVVDFAGVGLVDYILGEGSDSGPMLLVTDIGKKMLRFIEDNPTS